MERRRDYRLGLEYELTLTDERDGKVWSGLVTADVSATGLAFRSKEPHGFHVGERFEVRLLAQVDGRPQDVFLPMSGTGVPSGSVGICLLLCVPSGPVAARSEIQRPILNPAVIYHDPLTVLTQPDAAS